ncbi:hypothetical protein [Neomegalonema sp.]|uniref:hypothetical protein n=1 Tax=Neomegalonema sp. TaxID=2039713 RepID=UPI00261EFEA1|nr:hypothetical protein [Neomegalonema sp.]MDD2867686.1 hypothetical protein [Neomegalonema sp.]
MASTSVREIGGGLSGVGEVRRDRDLERAFGRAGREASRREAPGPEAAARERSWRGPAEGGERQAALRGWGEEGRPPVVDGFTSTLKSPESSSPHERP